MNRKRIWAVAYKEWREILRDRLFFSMAFLLPVLMLLVLGWGISFDVENIPFAVLDQDKSRLSREFVHRFIDSRYFDYQGDVQKVEQLDKLLAHSDIRFALVIPDKFQERLLAGQSTAVQSIIDGVFPYRAQVSKGYVAAIINNFNAHSQALFIARKKGLLQAQALTLVNPVQLHPRYLFNQPLRSSWSMASGLMMLVLMIAPPMLTVLGVVREKENGSIYNIYASTISRGEFILGKLAPYLLISCVNFLILWMIVIVLFDTPFKGNPLFYFAVSVLYVICTTGIGLLISFLVNTQVSAVMLTMVITFVPAMLYSGLLMPLSSLSETAQLQAHAFPAMYYLRLTWGSFLKGLGWDELWGNVIALMIYAGLLWVIAYFSFHKRPRQ
jgi:ABC-2 type transport system permease protein/ribosome-dependent ATPase